MPQEWLDALAPLGTDWHKEFLETAPYLIVVFRIDFGLTATAEGEKKVKHYYVQESVGIATGFLLAALHLSGLATLTHTRSPMGFLSTILERPKNERPFVLIPVGLPSPDATGNREERSLRSAGGQVAPVNRWQPRHGNRALGSAAASL